MAGADLTSVLAARPPRPWSGTAWRMHRLKYPPTDPGGSLLVSGRYNRGRDQFPEHEVFPALYLALSREVCPGEIMRHLRPERLASLNDYAISEIALQLGAVVDCRALEDLGLPSQRLCDDYDLSVPQMLAASV